MKKLFFAAGLVSLVGFAAPLAAQVIISEIMYDVPGTDAGYEWIEVHNTGSDPIDIAEWRLRENEVDHYLSLESGETSALPPGGYAIIASNSAKFLESHVGFSGIVFDSVFSLNNQGESLELVSGDQVVDSVYYTPQDGANGTGGSLQYFNNAWVASLATPGASNTNNPIEQEGNASSEQNASDNSGGSVSKTQLTARPKTTPFEPYYSGTLTTDPVLLAGAPLSFDFEMLFYREEGKKPIIKHRGTFVWNMGDGNEFTQDWEEEFIYVYEYPGTYTLHISYTRSSLSEEPDYVFQKSITVEKADVSIGMIDEQGGIRIDNKTGKNIDLSNWQLRYGPALYTFPQNTIIPAAEERFIAKRIHGFTYLFPGSYLPIEFLRPTGEVHQKEIVRDINTSQEDSFLADESPEIEEDVIETGEGVTIIDMTEKDPTEMSQKILWAIGGLSGLSLLGSLLLAWYTRNKHEYTGVPTH